MALRGCHSRGPEAGQSHRVFIVTVGTETECRQLATRVLFTLLCILTMRAKEYSPERTKSKVDCEANRVGWRWGKQSWGKTSLNELKPEE